MRRCTLRCEFLKYVFPHPGSSHLYVRRWDVADKDVVPSLWLEAGPTVDDDAVDDAGCLATDGGGAGAIGQSRLVLGGDEPAAQLTTMIAVVGDVSGTSMPPTLVRTTGTETGLALAVPPLSLIHI